MKGIIQKEIDSGVLCFTITEMNLKIKELSQLFKPIIKKNITYKKMKIAVFSKPNAFGNLWEHFFS